MATSKKKIKTSARKTGVKRAGTRSRSGATPKRKPARARAVSKAKRSPGSASTPKRGRRLGKRAPAGRAKSPKSSAKRRTRRSGASKTSRPRKKSLLEKYRLSKKDTGSAQFQIALFSEKIATLQKHLKKNIHDFDSKRGLLMLVGKRRRLLNYLKMRDQKLYQKFVSDLKLKK